MARVLSVSIHQSHIKLEATMLFHVMAQHDHQTCEGAMRARGESVAPRNETERWLEGNDKVKVLTALGYISEHRYYAIVDLSLIHI